MRISLNLATKPYADLGPAMQRLRVGMGVLAGVCLALLLGLHLVHTRAEAARAREHSLDGQLTRVRNERQGYVNMMQQSDNAQLLRQVNALNQVFDQKAFSWTLAMENLETVLPGGVAVTTLEPTRDKTGQITLHLRVSGPRNLGVDLVRNLEHSKRFLHPRIVGENAETAGAGSNQRLEPVSETNRFSFDILAEYNPPAPDERKAEKSVETKPAETPNTEPPAGGSVPLGVRRPPQTIVPARPNPGTPPGAMHKPNPTAPHTAPQGGQP
jgi:type IV pilus assembly protein PilN